METLFVPPKQQASLRRNDLDWLRAIAFSLLIFFHTGLIFNHWEWYIKNNVVSYNLNYPMMFLSQWRMPLLFVISGAGVYWSLRKRTVTVFTTDRIRRLLIPLIFGILVIVPPQIYFTYYADNQQYSYLDFYRHTWSMGFMSERGFNWNHLWYLGYIFLYSLLGIPLWFFLRKTSTEQQITRLAHLFKNPIWFISVPVGLLLIGELIQLPENQRGLLNDWRSHYRYFTLFCFGYILCSEILFWQILSRYRWLLVGVAMSMTTLLFFFFWRNWHNFYGVEAIVFAVLTITNYWCWLLAIFGVGYNYLNFSNGFLRYVNKAVYPFYVLHQTIIIAAGYYLAPLKWPWQVKFLIIIGMTFGGCLLIYHFCIRPFKLVRSLFGLP